MVTMASHISLVNMYIIAYLPIDTQAFPKATVGKFWPVRQIWPTTFFGTTHESRIVLTDEYL